MLADTKLRNLKQQKRLYGTIDWHGLYVANPTPPFYAYGVLGLDNPFVFQAFRFIYGWFGH